MWKEIVFTGITGTVVDRFLVQCVTVSVVPYTTYNSFQCA